MSSPAKVYIAGTGMVTPLGGNSAMTIAAVNAGISAYGASSFYNRSYSPIIAAVVPADALPALDEELKALGLNGREKRLIQMSAPALAEVFAAYPLEQSLPLFLAGPEVLASGAKPITAKILKHIAVQTKANLDLANSRYFASGRAGILEAIELAFRYFAETDAQYVLVGGIDSYLDMATLGYLDHQDRISADNVNNGFAPGEGAGFLLLASAKDPQNTETVALSEPGLAGEKGHIYSDQPYLGEGLSSAFSIAIKQGSGEKITKLFSSINGENFFAKEFGVAAIRHSTVLQENYSHQHPADCFGDLGAAAGAVLIALAKNDLLRNPQAAQHLVYCSSDLGSRAAVCIGKIII